MAAETIPAWTIEIILDGHCITHARDNSGRVWAVTHWSQRDDTTDEVVFGCESQLVPVSSESAFYDWLGY